MSRGLIGRDARKQCVGKQIAERPLMAAISTGRRNTLPENAQHGVNTDESKE